MRFLLKFIIIVLLNSTNAKTPETHSVTWSEKFNGFQELPNFLAYIQDVEPISEIPPEIYSTSKLRVKYGDTIKFKCPRITKSIETKISTRASRMVESEKIEKKPSSFTVHKVDRQGYESCDINNSVLESHPILNCHLDNTQIEEIVVKVRRSLYAGDLLEFNRGESQYFVTNDLSGKCQRLALYTSKQSEEGEFQNGFALHSETELEEFQNNKKFRDFYPKRVEEASNMSQLFKILTDGVNNMLNGMTKEQATTAQVLFFGVIGFVLFVIIGLTICVCNKKSGNNNGNNYNNQDLGTYGTNQIFSFRSNPNANVNAQNTISYSENGCQAMNQTAFYKTNSNVFGPQQGVYNHPHPLLVNAASADHRGEAIAVPLLNENHRNIPSSSSNFCRMNNSTLVRPNSQNGFVSSNNYILPNSTQHYISNTSGLPLATPVNFQQQQQQMFFNNNQQQQQQICPIIQNTNITTDAQQPINSLSDNGIEISPIPENRSVDEKNTSNSNNNNSKLNSKDSACGSSNVGTSDNENIEERCLLQTSGNVKEIISPVENQAGNLPGTVVEV